MTTATADRLLHPVQQLIEAAGSALDDTGDPLLVGLTDGEVDRALVGMEALISRLRVRQLALVAEARVRNRAGSGGAATRLPGGWLCCCRPTRPTRRVGCGRRPSSMPRPPTRRPRPWSGTRGTAPACCRRR